MPIRNATHRVIALTEATHYGDAKIVIDARHYPMRISAHDSAGAVEVEFDRPLAREVGCYLVEWAGDNPTLHAADEWTSLGRTTGDPTAMAVTVEDGECTLTFSHGGCGMALRVDSSDVCDIGIRLIAFAGPYVPPTE